MSPQGRPEGEAAARQGEAAARPHEGTPTSPALTAKAEGLHGVLADFAVHVNGHASLRGPLAGWSPRFYIQARDSGATFRVSIVDGMVGQVQSTTDEPDDDALLLRGDAGLIEGIFSGRTSPLAAYTDGLLEVYGSPKDQIKLDVIALVLWGA